MFNRPLRLSPDVSLVQPSHLSSYLSLGKAQTDTDSFVSLTRTLDLRFQQIAQVVRLRHIHHFKYPLAFRSLGVDYSNDDYLISGIRQ